MENLEKSIERMSEEVGGIGKSNGAMAEEFIFNALEKDMIFGGIEFYDISTTFNKYSKRQNLRGQYDIVLTNGDTIAIIEIKYKVRKEDVTKFFTTQVDKFRKLFPFYANYKIVLGVGGMSFEKEANANGIGIIKIVGDKVEYHTNEMKIY
jgi:hypothetical protein